MTDDAPYQGFFILIVSKLHVTIDINKDLSSGDFDKGEKYVFSLFSSKAKPSLYGLWVALWWWAFDKFKIDREQLENCRCVLNVLSFCLWTIISNHPFRVKSCWNGSCSTDLKRDTLMQQMDATISLLKREGEQQLERPPRSQCICVFKSLSILFNHMVAEI